jgi:hypothetical protein
MRVRGGALAVRTPAALPTLIRAMHAVVPRLSGPYKALFIWASGLLIDLTL